MVNFIAISDPARAVPNVCEFATASILQAATTRLECNLVEALKLGGLQRQKFVGQAAKEFANATDKAGPSDHVHPLLATALRSK